MHLSQVQLNPVYKKMSDINDLRNKMDAVTLEMINLLKTRTNIAREIGEVKKNTILQVKGRHDPCVVPRAAPVVDSLVALTIADHALITGAIKPSL